ncbi:MAG: HEPN domain-containing protein [Actinomycetota bacterium]|nr:HEPN domain-containing protein [Actinomycetota bacterium]
MNFEDWLKKGSIKPFKPVGTQVEDLFASAEKDIKASQEILGLGYYGVSRDTAYEAMLKTGMALMFHHGFRPEAGSHRLTIIRFAERILGSKDRHLILEFDRLRRSRHQRLYRRKEQASKSQVQKAVKTAQELLKASI